MTENRWQETKALFAEARDLLEDEREILLCLRERTAPEIVAEVRRLLASEALSTDFLEPPTKSSIERPLQLLSFDFRGLRLGDFELEEEIGRGASGVVYLGVQRSLARKVAIKILAPQLASTALARQRFEREAKAASRLRHDGIVTVLAFGEQQGALYLVMEHVPGKTLHQHLETARLASDNGEPIGTTRFDVHSPRTAARIALSLAEALDYCHGQGIVHRDIKPQNVLITSEGSPRVVDFGVAKDRGLDGITSAGIVSGTPHYMSPEQAQARSGELDARTDIYSLGVVLYEMLTLHPPFEGNSPHELVQRLLTERAPPAHHSDPDVPRALSAICARALRKDPRQRYESARDMAKDLRAYLDGESVALGARIKLEDAYRSVFVKRPWIAIAGIVVLFAAIVIYPSEGSSQGGGTSLSDQPATTATDPASPDAQREELLRRVGEMTDLNGMPKEEQYRFIREMAENLLPDKPISKHPEKR